MALLTVQKPSLTGTVVVEAAAGAGGDSFPNTGAESFVVNNGGGAPITVTFHAGPNPCSFGLSGGTAHDLAVAVAAGERRVIGPFPVMRFNDASNNVQVTYSAVTTVTVAVRSAA